MSDRHLDWVDYAKGIAIVLMVYGHIARGLNTSGILADSPLFLTADSVIYSFHMPLFFFLSGLFFRTSFERYGARPLLKRRAATLLYPYVVWSLIQGSVEMVLARYTNGNVTLRELLSFMWMPRAQFWFLYAMILFTLFDTGVFALTRRAGMSVCVFFAALFFFFPRLLPGSVPLCWLSAYMIYFNLGMMAEHYKLFSRPQPWRVAAGAAFVFPVVELLFHMAGWTFNTGPKIGRLACALAGIFFFCLLAGADRSPLRRFWVFLGRNSLYIYLMHTLAGSGIRIVLQKFAGIADPAVHLTAGMLAGIALPLLAATLLNMFRMDFLFRWPAVRRKNR